MNIFKRMDFPTKAFAFALVSVLITGLIMVVNAVPASREGLSTVSSTSQEAPTVIQRGIPAGRLTRVHDPERKVTCYMLRNGTAVALDCVPDTQLTR